MTACWNTAGVTDAGLLRSNNEDRYWIDAENGVFLVVDGVGGHAAGELAAQTAVETIRSSVYEPGTAEQRVRNAITRANNEIFDLAAKDKARNGMACVLTLALVEDDVVTIGHVGDSRLYLLSNGSIKKLTSDHSPVGEDEDAGQLTEVQAMCHPRRNEVFREVGSQKRHPGDDDFIEIRECRFRADAALLLCSDGLTDQLTASQVREIVNSYQGDSAYVANALVEAANAAGGHDNITVLFVAGRDFRGSNGATRARFSTTRVRPQASLFTGRTAFLIYGLLLSMLVWAVWQVRG